MTVACNCYREILAEDDARIVRDACLVHGPRKTPELERAYLVQEHTKLSALREEKLRAMHRAVMQAVDVDPWLDRRVSDAIARGCIAALQYYEKDLRRNMVPDPRDTPQRQELIERFGVDPEE